MRWIVRVARTMDDVKECHFTDKDKDSSYDESKASTEEVKHGSGRCHCMDGGN